MIQKQWWEIVYEGLLTALIGGEVSPGDPFKAKVAIIPLPHFGTIPHAPVGVLETRELKHCEPELQRRYALVKAYFELETGRHLFETCTWRSEGRQQQLFRQGRSEPGQIVTNIDGINSRSRHNFYPSQAVDVCVDSDPGPGKVAVWDNAAYAPLGPLCEKHGLVWGGNFKRLIDSPHLELPADWS